MTQPSLTTSNPFATRYVAPGKLPWIESETGEIEKLAVRFAALGHRAQIVGPHGSGKTTLLHHLISQLSNATVVNPTDQPSPMNCSGQCQWLTLRRGSDSDRVWKQYLRSAASGDLLVLDGFEQLNWFQQYWIRILTRVKSCRLLVTCHASVGLPTLAETRLTTRLAENIVGQLLLDSRGGASWPSCLDPLDLPSLLNRHQGNMRECLMELYDVFEDNRSIWQNCKNLPQPGDAK